MVSTDRLAEVFVEIADTLVDDFDLIDFLHRLADSVNDVTGGSSAGLLLADHNGTLHYMTASTEAAESLELFQLQHSEGPCLDCFHSKKPVITNDLAQAMDRWPHFAPRALDVGIHSVHAFPMRLRERVIGAMNVFGDGGLRLEDPDIRIVQALADVATIAILQERAIASAELLTEQLQGALNSRIVIEQAKGMIARDHDVSVDAAFSALRMQARSTHVRLADLASRIVSGEVDLPRT
ncbi:GAF and ANTAR domain-containing protein [Aeromicrobium sp.]|uniref:GAF and ANTAR domain-containing protein n=1 Tax=Aeromicrobium sp. TaxID=1871063 RepID=UPI003C56E9AE